MKKNGFPGKVIGGHSGNYARIIENGDGSLSVYQGSEVLAYRNGGTPSDYESLYFITAGNSLVLNCAPSFNSVCDRQRFEIFNEDGAAVIVEL